MRYLAPVLLSGLLAISCKKNSAPAAPTKTQLLSSSTWKFESGGLDFNHDGTVDIPLSTGIVPACLLDNTAVFNANGSGTADEGATKCSATNPQTSPFSWNFVSNETAININGAGLFGLGGQFSIKELTTARFSLSKDTTIATVTSTMIVNLQH